MTSTEQFADIRRGELATARLQEAIDAAAGRGGGRVSVPAGVHRTGALRLRSRVELHLESGAILQFDPDPALYPVIDVRWEGAEEAAYSPCLYAQGESDVAITGLGVIDGAGSTWWDVFRHRPSELEHPRPTLIGLHDCSRVTIRDVALRNSPSWTVHPALCDGVTISNIQITNPSDSPNTDGINPESSRNIRISDCHIDVGDDCIAIKAGTEWALDRVSCENIAITNCTMVRGHGGVVIGSEMSGDVRNVAISNCIFQGTDRGIRLKTRRGRGGVVENIRVNNIIMDDVMTPITVNSFYHCGPDGKLPIVGDRTAQPVGAGTPSIRDLRISNVTARNVQASAGHIYGLPEAPVRDLTIRDMSVSFADEPEADTPEMAAGVEPVVRQGMELGFISGGALSGIALSGVRGELTRTLNCEDLMVDVSGGSTDAD